MKFLSTEPESKITAQAAEKTASKPLQSTARRLLSNRHMLKKLVVVAVLMFAFGYALVPLYKKICEITGVNVLTPVDENAAAFAANTQVDKTRWVTVVFDANVQGPWRFRPVKNSVQVHPGELTTIVYEIANQQARRMAGQAIPSYVPQKAAGYFKKVECFCFQQQTLQAHETKQFPVVFVIDPALPKTIETITLSYTFFEVAGAAGKSETLADK